MSHRREQLESTLKRSLGKLLSEGLNDPRIKGLVSVTRVKLTEDGHTARVGISVLPESGSSAALHGLRHAAGHLRRALDREMSVRTMPHLDFYIDESLKQQARILAAIREAVDEQRPRDAAPGSAAEEAGEGRPEPPPSPEP